MHIIIFIDNTSLHFENYKIILRKIIILYNIIFIHTSKAVDLIKQYYKYLLVR